MIDQLNLQIDNVFEFMTTLIENSVIAHEKFNEIARNAAELENRYNKMCSTLESSQKESKFMTEYIKKMSQDNLVIKRKNGELERSNKNLEETCKKLKKNLFEKGELVESHSFKREVDVVSTHNIGFANDEEELNISRGSNLSSHTSKRSPILMKMLIPEKATPSCLNFKKKGLAKSQERP